MSGMLFACLRYGQIRCGYGRIPLDLEAVVLLAGLSAIASTCEFIFSVPRHYYAALVARCTFFLLLIPFVTGSFEVELLLLCGVLIELSVYEPYPRNLALCGGLLVLALAMRLPILIHAMSLPLSEAIVQETSLLLTACLLVVPATFFTRYREDIVTVREEMNRLDSMTMQLAKLNLQYQSSAAEASEKGMRNERLRITRDIHDIVGYTLTNNIAMMEAATDMIRRNPLGVPALINAARDNAKEGLQQIRAALYQLRAREDQTPVGLRAITRLCRLFETATRTNVRLAYGNARWEYGDAVDSAIYHLIQEALLNAFCHGRAAHVTVALWESEAEVAVSISDDGSGAENPVEGIGLRGMRERVDELGGELWIDARPGAFSVRARIPTGEASHG